MHSLGTDTCSGKRLKAERLPTDVSGCSLLLCQHIQIKSFQVFDENRKRTRKKPQWNPTETCRKGHFLTRRFQTTSIYHKPPGSVFCCKLEHRKKSFLFILTHTEALKWRQRSHGDQPGFVSPIHLTRAAKEQRSHGGNSRDCRTGLPEDDLHVPARCSLGNKTQLFTELFIHTATLSQI